MSRRASRGSRLGCTVALLASGCARLVTLDPAIVSKRNDETWSVRAAPGAATATEAPQIVQPLPFTRRPEVMQALRSAPDDRGIPSNLYAVDPLLSAHRRETESQARARHQVGAGLLVSGLVFTGLSTWAIAWGSTHANDPKTQNDATQLIADGVFLGALSLGELIGGIMLAASGSDAGPLQHYYRETYVSPP
jgi:hypothetical protein